MSWIISFGKQFLVLLENGTRRHFVSIDFHEFKIEGIITPTMTMLSIKNKYSHVFWYLSFILHLKNITCGSDYAANLMFTKVDWNSIIMCFIILIAWKTHFHTKILFWITKFSLFKKQKVANLLSGSFPTYRILAFEVW